MDNRRWCESNVPQALAVGFQAVRLSWLSGDWWGTLVTLLVTFCIVIIRCTEGF
jgi:hypothetical protein